MQTINMSQSRYESHLHTPIKYTASLGNTNPSLSYSASLTLSRSRQPDYNRMISPVHQLFRDNIASQTQTVRDDIQNNTSAVTLQPVISRSQMQELIQLNKMVAFYTNQHIQNANIIHRKSKIIEFLKQDIQNQEYKVKRQRASYKKQKSSLSRSKSKQRQSRRRKSIAQQQEIQEMELQIISLKKTLEYKRQKKYNMTYQESKRTQRQKDSPRRKKNIIYMPVPMPYPYHYQHHHPVPQQQHIHNPHTNVQNIVPHNSAPTQAQTYRSNSSQVQPINVLNPPHSSPQIIESNTWNKNIQHETGQFHHSGNVAAPGPQNNPIFQIIQNKQQELAQNMFQKEQPQDKKQIKIKKKEENDIGIITEEDLAIASKLQKEQKGVKINLNKVTRTKYHESSPQNLEYFNNEESVISYKEEEQSKTQNIKKSGEKWVGDAEDLETIQLLQKSINNENKPEEKLNIASKIVNKSPKEKKQKGFTKLIVSHLCEQKQSEDSQINISVQSEANKIGNKSRDSSEKKDGRLSPRINIMLESNVDVVLGRSNEEENNDLPDLPKQSITKDKQMKFAIQMSNIMEQDQDAVSTPMISNDSGAFNNFQKKLRSSGQQRRPSLGNNNSLQLSQSHTAQTAPLQKPPSLDEYKQQPIRQSLLNQQIFDMRLTAKSVHAKQAQQSIPDVRFTGRSEFSEQNGMLKKSMKSIPAKSQFQSNYFGSEDDFDEELDGINLLAQSKHSRENPLSGFIRKNSGNHDDMSRSLPNELQIRKFDQIKNKGKAGEDDEDEMPVASPSRITRQGSAITKSKNKAQRSELRVSYNNNTSALSKSSGLMSLPIQEATQEQQIASKIMPRIRSSQKK